MQLKNKKLMLLLVVLCVKISCQKSYYDYKNECSDEAEEISQAAYYDIQPQSQTKGTTNDEDDKDGSRSLVKEGGLIKLSDLAQEINNLIDTSKHTDNNITYWGHWSDWSECSATCGKGREVRWRNCTQEECKNGNAEMETRQCQLPSCGPPEVSELVQPIKNAFQEMAANISSRVFKFFGMLEENNTTNKPS